MQASTSSSCCRTCNIPRDRRPGNVKPQTGEGLLVGESYLAQHVVTHERLPQGQVARLQKAAPLLQRMMRA
jgi:hypothetical protein